MKSCSSSSLSISSSGFNDLLQRLQRQVRGRDWNLLPVSTRHFNVEAKLMEFLFHDHPTVGIVIEEPPLHPLNLLLAHPLASKVDGQASQMGRGTVAFIGSRV